MLNNTEDHRQYMTTPQAAQRSGLSKTYLTKLLRNGSLEGFRLGRDWLIYTESLERFLAAPHKPGPKGPRKKPSPSQVQDHPDTLSTDAHHEHGSDKS
jgi:excisionase family DNA binding protein